MTPELWLGLGHYLLGVLTIFTLLVALMETSRKYDRHHDSAYLWLATGYFMLIIWALTWATVLTASSILIFSNIVEAVGLICLVIGYHLNRQLHNDDEDTMPSPQTTLPITNRVHTHDWTDAFVARFHQEAKESETEAATDDNKPQTSIVEPPVEKKVDAPIVADTDLAVEPPQVAPTKKTKKLDRDGDVDLSYLSSRRKKVETRVAQPKQLAELPSVPTVADPGPSKPTPAKREKMMNELFPLSTQPKNESDDLLPGERLKKVTAIFALPFGSLSSVAIWPEIASFVLALILVVILIPQRKHRGMVWILTGFILLALSSLGSLLFMSHPLGPVMIEAVACGCIGFGSWIKIRGKVTHHFIKIVSLLYLLLLLLAVGLASVIVHDLTTLQLLLILMTGVLITILPIIHALTYSHPHQPSVEDMKL